MNFNFPTFLEFISSSKKLNPHWAPASQTCNVRSVTYGKIITLETQTQDLLSVLPRLGAYHRGREVHANENREELRSSVNKTLDAYRNVSPQLLDKVLSLGFDADLALFGYPWRKNSPTIEISCADKSGCC